MKTYILLIMAVVILSCSKEEKKCTISGGLTGGDSKTILLFKASKFPVYETEIPVSNGRFSYSFTFTQPEVYWLMPKEKFQRGVINEVPIVGERGKIEISMNTDNGGYDVEGHQLNKALLAYYKDLNRKFLNEAVKYRDSVALMYRNGTVFSKDFKELQDALPKTKDPIQRDQILNAQRNLRSMGAMYNPKAKQFVKMQDSIAAAQKKWEEEYVDQNTSIPAYYLFMKNLKGLAASKNGKVVDNAVLEKAKKIWSAFPLNFRNTRMKILLKILCRDCRPSMKVETTLILKPVMQKERTRNSPEYCRIINSYYWISGLSGQMLLLKPIRI